MKYSNIYHYKQEQDKFSYLGEGSKSLSLAWLQEWHQPGEAKPAKPLHLLGKQPRDRKTVIMAKSTNIFTDENVSGAATYNWVYDIQLK